jgi:hypothetical protein
MQSRRRRDLNAFQRAPLLLDSFAAHGLDELAATLRNFARFAKRRTTNYAPRARRDFTPVLAWILASPVGSPRCSRPIKMPESRDGGALKL